MRKIFILAALLLVFSQSQSQRIISKTWLMTMTVAQMDSMLNANGIGIVTAILPINYDIDVYRIDYNTVSYDSSATYASGMLAVPRDTNCHFPMLVYHHGTVSDKLGAPSYLSGQEPVIGMVLASAGYVVSEPDYLGLGDGPGLHPYQHAKTEASASIDMLRSAREYCDSAHIHRNGQLFLMGYSQGGHACMATHRTIQNQLNGEFNVTAAVPMSGAHDMSGVMINTMLSDTPYSQPGYLAYLVISWNPIYHLYDSIQQAFKAPYDTILPPLLNGAHNINALNAAMPSVAKHAFTPAELDTFVNNPTAIVRQALVDNDVYNWQPHCPVRLYFCKADKFVPYMNSIVAINKLRQNGCADCDTLDVNPSLDHVACAQPSIISAGQFFQRYAHIDSCTQQSVLGINQLSGNSFATVYPNPAKDKINIEAYSTGALSASLYDMNGRLVLSTSLVNGINSISAASLSEGVYVLKISDSQGYSSLRKVAIEK
jgi:acetyl esterase/lipase